MASLELTNIRKVFGTTPVVEDFNLKAESGEFISFLGPSGCGKSTTLRMIAGFEIPTAGMIQIDQNDISRIPANKRNVGMVFQSYGLFPNLTAAENIGFGMKIRKRSKAEIQKKVEELLALIHLPNKGNSYPYHLSGGQQQRVALARALAIEPQVLLLDEPLSALDAKIRIELRTEIRAIQRKLGTTTIYVTHDQEEALSISDRVVVMREGKIEQVGTPFEIYNFPKTRFVASFVGTLNLVEAQVLDANGGVLALDGQSFKVQRALGSGSPAVATIALRPEMVSLTPGENRVNGFDCRIETITFLGSVVRIQVRLEKTKLFFDTFNNPNLVLPAIGQPVKIYFSPEACLVL